MAGTDDPVGITVAGAARRLIEGIGSPLGGVAAARELSSVAETALQATVDRAREAGLSWREIGDVLGTTRQAAFQRFGHPVDPRTGAPMNREVPAGTADRAIVIIGCLAEGRWEDARRDFGERMRAGLDAERLARGWAHTIGLIGGYEGMGEPIAHRAGDDIIVQIPLRFEAGERTGRVIFDETGAVAGLWLTAPGPGSEAIPPRARPGMEAVR